MGRFLDHCLYAAQAAATLIEPFFAPVDLAVPLPGVVLGGPRTADDAMDWFMTEGGTLLAAVHLAADAGFATHAWQLAWALSTFLLRCGRWSEQAEACRTGLEAARRAADPAGEAHGLLLLALGYARSGRFDDASPQFRRAVRLLERLDGYLGSKVTAYSGLTWIAERQQRYADMLATSLRALELSRAAGDRTMEVMSLRRRRLQQRPARELRAGDQLLRACPGQQPGSRRAQLGGGRVAQPRLHTSPARQPPARHRQLRAVS